MGRWAGGAPGQEQGRDQGGDEPAQFAADVRKLTSEAFELLEAGLRDYLPRPAQPESR